MSLLFLLHYRKSFSILKHCPWIRKNKKKTVSHCRKWVIPYLYTLRRTIAYAYTLPNAIPYLDSCIPFLNTCIACLNTLSQLPILTHVLRILIHWLGFRLSVPYFNTCNAYRNTLSQLSTSYLNTWTAYLNTLNRLPFFLHPLHDWATNQIRVLRHSSRQPIRIEYYVTRELSARVENPSRLSARIGSLETILKHRVFNFT